MKSVPKLTIPPPSFVFLLSSFLHPPLPESSLILSSSCILASPSSLYPTRSSLISPFICAGDPMALATPSLGSSGSFLGCPVRGIYEFPGFWGFDRFFPVPCAVLHCIDLLRASHALAHIALRCIELCSIALRCICFAHLSWQYFAFHCPCIRFPWQCVALRCRCIDCILVTAFSVLVGNSFLLGPRR